MTREEFRARHPGAVLLEKDDAPGIEAFLRTRGWMSEEDRVIGAWRAGDGNMNCTLRVGLASGRRLILKQARPWVEKYDHIPAPWNRALVEAEFYRLVGAVPGVGDRMPVLNAADAEARALMLEDVGEAGDFTDLYRGAALADAESGELVDYLSALHALMVPAGSASRLRNLEMRRLNHLLFEFPLAPDNGLDPDRFSPGLTAAATQLKGDADYRARVQELGAGYLADGPCLLHGDFFPGSWLRSAGGIKVIDPEFCFLGAPEIELGTFGAHLLLAGRGLRRAESVVEGYEAQARRKLDRPRVWGYCGVEIMRRLIGVAQLPLHSGPGERQALLRLSRVLVTDPAAAFDSNRDSRADGPRPQPG